MNCADIHIYREWRNLIEIEIEIEIEIDIERATC